MAIQPHFRPMTSTTKMRSSDVAVSLILSRASRATLTAVSAPMALSTPVTSLSIVAGTPTTGKPCRSARTRAPASEPLPPMTMRPSIAAGAEMGQGGLLAVFVAELLGPGRFEDRPAEPDDVGDGAAVEGDEIAAHEPLVAAHDALDGEPAGHRRPDDGPDGRVDAAAVPRQEGDLLHGPDYSKKPAAPAPRMIEYSY